jgi:hypothetical protein
MEKETQPKNQTHILHKQVAKTIHNIGRSHKYEVIVDYACVFDGYPGRNQRIPFFLSDDAARYTTVSNVDIILIKNKKVKLVCEIEESGFIPTKIFGKLFSTAFADICRLWDGKKHHLYNLDNNSVFIEVMEKPLPEETKKIAQGNLIEKKINKNLKTINSWIKKYRLIYGDDKDFEKPGRAGYDEIERIINTL